VKQQIDNDRFPEWQPFLDAVQQRRPDAGSWCEAWTVRDIVIHQAGNAEELARVLGAHLAGEPVATRGFEEREAPLRAMNETDLLAGLHRNMATLNEVAEAADDVPADTDVAWTGRTMKVPWFAEHMREELVLNRRRNACPAAVGPQARRPIADLQPCRSGNLGQSTQSAGRLLT
jgi:Mycothiol maleylpyruvate isomerase N-terminal domain